MVKLTREAQYSWAVDRVETLLPLVDEDTPEDDPARIELDLLSELVADYSDEHYGIGEPSLIDMLKYRMEEMGLSQKGLAELLGISPSRVSDLVTGKCEPTLKLARTISRKLDIDPSFVLGA